jgi:putative hydrolase of the HAD superfamily
MTYRAVLFDLFGTLVPCYPLARLDCVVQEMAGDLGVPAEPFAVEWQRTVSDQIGGRFPTLETHLHYLLDRLCASPLAEGLVAAVERRLVLERSALRPRPDAIPTLTHLRAQGLGAGVITNCSNETVRLWPSTELASAVDHLSGSCVIRSIKPNPQIYRHACSELAVAPNECLFVADGSDGELEGAMAVGMDAVLIRAADDDGSFPGRIARCDWTGAFVSALPQLTEFM